MIEMVDKKIETNFLFWVIQPKQNKNTFIIIIIIIIITYKIVRKWGKRFKFFKKINEWNFSPLMTTWLSL